MAFGSLKKIAKKAVKYGTLGAVDLNKKKDSDSGTSSSAAPTMRDVARQRAAGAGTINYTESTSG